MRFTLPAVLSLAALAGCASGPTHVNEATPAQKAALLDRVKSHQGTWEATDEKGQKHVSSVFSVSSGGSAVREILLPGTEHEMTNVYHMDGSSLMMTHYCAVGNQPHLRATEGAPTQIAFHCDSVSNYTVKDGTYMGQMVLTFKDQDHIVEEWTSFTPGEKPNTMSFALARKK
jgi:hypothetical protein